MEQKHFESLYPETSRDKEIEHLVEYIKEGHSAQLVGLPGVGRSNILNLLTYNKAVRLRHFPKHHGIIHFVMVNFSEVKRRPYADVVKFLFLCLDNSLRDREMQAEYLHVDGLFKDALTYSDELVIAQSLKNAVEYLALERKLSIVFLFDRFDDYIPQVSEDFFTLLRSLRDRAKYRFSAVFSLVRPLEDVLEPHLMADFSDFLSGHVIYLPLLDEPSISFRIGYLEKLTAKSLTAKEKAEIVALTGGHIRLTKVAVEAFFAHTGEVSSMEAFLLSQSTIQAALLSIWKSLTLAEQNGIATESLDKKESVYLSNVGFLKNSKPAILLLMTALQQGIFKENEAKIRYDEASNTIKKGEQTVSDNLTKAEFRLLRYLLQHPEEVVERETIVSTVWKDDKSSEGITDQAIDQLVFRLRRKIEEDPNNPLHLLTIKGRGVKFSN